MPDIFDEIHAETTGGAPKAPQGDIFDQIHAEQNVRTSPQVQTQAAPAQPPNLEQYLQTRPLYERMAAKVLTNPILGGAASAVAQAPVAGAAMKTIAQPIQGMMGLASPNAGQAVQQGVESAYGNQGGLAGVAGRALGGAVNLPYYLTPIGRMMSAGAAAGNERINIANQRQTGQQMGGAEELARSAGVGALDWATSKLTNAFGGKIFSSMPPAVGQTATQLVAQYAKNFGKDAVTNEVLTHASIAANNLISGRPVAEGMGANSIADALVQTAGQLGLHAATVGAPRIKQMFGGNNVQETQPVPQGPPAPTEAKPPVPIERPEALPEHPAGEQERPAKVRGGTEGTEKPAAPSEHPARLSGGKPLADYVAKISPDSATAPLIGTMTEPHGEYVQARVPIDQLHGLGGTEEGVVAGKGGEQKNPAVTVPSGVGGEGHLDLIDGNHSVEALRQAGATHATAYVPESMVGQHGIEPIASELHKEIPANSPLTAGEEEAAQAMERHGRATQPLMPVGNEHEAMESHYRAVQQETGTEEKPQVQPVPQATEPKIKQMMRRPTERPGAVALPSREDIAGPGSVYHEEIKPQISKFAQAGKEIKEGLKGLFPVETGAGNEKAQNIFREQFNRRANEHSAIAAALNDAHKGFDKMKPDDRLDFQRRMYNNDPQATPELQKTADQMYQDANEGRKALVDLGHESAREWDERKYNMLWRKDPAKAAELKAALSGTPNRPGKIAGPAGFLKQQKLSEFDEGLERGLVPKYDNPVDMFLATKAERGKYIAGVRGMEQLLRNDLVKRMPQKGTIPGGWTEVPSSAKGPLNGILAKGEFAEKLKGEGPLIAPEGVTRILKNITTPSAIGNKAAFRIVMDANNTITQSLLGISGFHLKKVSQELINMNAARALDIVHARQSGALGIAARGLYSPYEAARTGGTIQKMMLGQMEPQTAAQARAIDAMKTQFKAKADPEYETQWGRKFQKAMADGGLQGTIRALGHAPLAGNEWLMQKGVFGFVQRAKLYMGHEFVQDYLAKHPDATHDELVKETGKISDHLDNVLGLMNRDNLFWNRTARDLATLSTLSVGWNYGSGRALGGGILDLGKGLGTLAKGGDMSKMDTRRMSYLLTTGALTALTGAATTYMATGKAPQSLKDLVFPPSGAKDRDGHDIRLKTGFYTSDWYDFIHHPLDTLGSKASPLVHAASDIIRNKDYKGNRIADWDDGKWYQVAGQIAKYLGKSATPISMQQLHDVITGGGKGTGPLKAAGFLGVTTARRSLSMSDAENEAHKIMQGKQTVAGRSEEESAKGTMMRDLEVEEREHKPEAIQKLQDMIKAGKLTPKDARSVIKRSQEPTGLKGLLTNTELDAKTIMEKVWPKMTPQEQKESNLMLRQKIGRANLPPEQKRAYWQQLEGAK